MHIIGSDQKQHISSREEFRDEEQDKIWNCGTALTLQEGNKEVTSKGHFLGVL